MKTKATKFSFASDTKNLLVEAGRIEDAKMRNFLAEGLGIKQKKVEARRHTILGGPPGVGKSYGALDLCLKNKIRIMMVRPGTSDINFVCELAYEVSQLLPGQELVVILDDADDVVFSDYDTLNKWKIAMAKPDPRVGFVPSYSHAVSMTNTIEKLSKTNPQVAAALTGFQRPGQIGVEIPTNQVRFVILCNLDLENPKLFRGKMRGAVEAAVSRIRYKRIELAPEVQWGWLASVLETTQPFEEYSLSVEQKITLLNWMYSNLPRLRDISYRTVEDLAAAMINEPNNYEDSWNENLKAIKN
jgi:hypothetical protein